MDQQLHDDTVSIPRERIFVLKNGCFVIQWQENRVQDLLSGQYLRYTPQDYDNAITDYELNQLINCAIVADYDTEFVYLYPDIHIETDNASRTYYLNTTIPKARVAEVTRAIQSHPQLAPHFAVRIQEIFVIIRAAQGIPYQNFDDAERARELLLQYLPDLLSRTVVAFVAITERT